MTATLFFGCVLLAYGPAAALLLLYVARRSALLVVALLAAVALLLARLALALLCLAAPGALRSSHAAAAVAGALLQEGARLLLALAYARAEGAVDSLQLRRLRAQRERERERSGGSGVRGDDNGGVSGVASDHASGSRASRTPLSPPPLPPSPRLSNDLAAALAAGCGWGLMHTVMAFGAALSASAGEEAWFRPACPALNAFALTAATALLYTGLHVALTVQALDAFRRRSAARALTAPVLHVAFALTALLGEASPPPFAGACAALLPLLLLELGAAVLWAVFGVIRRPEYAAALQVAEWSALTARRGLQ
jgi:anterior pharynx defective protein 1